MSIKFFTVQATEQGTKYHLDIPMGDMFVLESMICPNGNVIVGFEIDDDESDDDQTKLLYIARLNEHIPTHVVNLKFDLQYVDFVCKGNGIVHFKGMMCEDPHFQRYDDEEIIEGGFEMN